MSQNQTTCPFCAEDILPQARKCKHCGEWLDKTGVSVPSASGSDAARAVAHGIKKQKLDEGSFTLSVLAAFFGCGLVAYLLRDVLGGFGFVAAIGVFLWLFARLRKGYYSE